MRWTLSLLNHTVFFNWKYYSYGIFTFTPNQVTSFHQWSCFTSPSLEVLYWLNPEGMGAAPGKSTIDSHCSCAKFSSFSCIKASQFVVCYCSFTRAMESLFLTIFSSSVFVSWGDFLTCSHPHQQKSCLTWQLLKWQINLKFSLQGIILYLFTMLTQIWVSGDQNSLLPGHSVCPPCCTIGCLNPVWYEELYISTIIASNFLCVLLPLEYHKGGIQYCL